MSNLDRIVACKAVIECRYRLNHFLIRRITRPSEHEIDHRG